MLDIAEFNAKIEGVLSRNLDTTIEAIKQNMVKNNQVVSGKTQNSLRKEINGNEGAIIGLDHIDTLEIGISPQRSQIEMFGHTMAALMTWVEAKQGFTFNFGITKGRWAYLATRNQRDVGSVLFRSLNGGRRGNVYSNEIQPLTDRIMNEIGDVIINTKIL